MLHLTQKTSFKGKEISSFLHCHSTLMSQPHNHDFYELAVISQGNVKQIINDCEQILSSGSIHFVCPSDTHCYVNASPDLIMLNITVRADIADALISFLNMRLNKLAYAGIDFCGDIIENWKKSLSVTKELLLKIASALTENEGNRFIPDWLKNTYKSLSEDCNFSQGVQFAVSYSGRSSPHLSREFKKYYGLTIIEYITNLRLSYAKRLLTKTDLNITEIALRCGYFGVSHFNHIFLKRFLMPPREYRTKFTLYI